MLYDKNSESDYFFFPPPKSEYFFQQHWESEYYFRKNVPWSTVPLLLPLFGSVPTDLAQCLTVVLSEIYRGQKDPTL